MRAVIGILAIAATTACEKPEYWAPVLHPEYYAHWSDRMKERFPELQSVFGPSCIWRGFEGLPGTVGDSVDDCFRMTDRRRWSGLWRVGFEASRFCPDGEYDYGGGLSATATECSDDMPRFDIWLGFKDEDRTPKYGLYRVEFIGRRTKHPKGPYGGMGVSDHEMIVDRMISIRKVID